MSNDLLPGWEAKGFAAPPEEFEAKGGEVLVRAFSPDAQKNRDSAQRYAAGFKKLDDAGRKELAFGHGHGTSDILRNCFFVPAFGTMDGAIMPRAIDTSGWDGKFLEDNLSAFIFGNDYAALAFYRMPRGLPYAIGTIARHPRFVSNGRIVNSGPKDHCRPDSRMLRQVILRPGTKIQLGQLILISTQRIMGLGKISPYFH